MPTEIIKPGTYIDFLTYRKVCACISLALILAGLVAIPVRDIRWGIDFDGGTEVQVRFTGAEPVDEGRIREVVQGVGIPGASVIRYGAADANEFLIKFKQEEVDPRGLAGEGAAPERTASLEPVSAGAESASDPGGAAAAVEIGDGEAAAESPAGKPVEAPDLDRVAAVLAAALADRIGALDLQRVEFVGPKVGAELRRAGILALSLACLLILIYIGFRFSARFAPGAVFALVHDVLITSGLWVILGLEFDLRVLAALLAIVGYSLNDTIIVYDRIRENLERHTKLELEEVLNRSVSQTLSRTLLTSVTTLLAVLSLLALGGEVIRPFALAMTIGILIGTYSSIYVAAPTLLFLERRFGGTQAGPARA